MNLRIGIILTGFLFVVALAGCGGQSGSETTTIAVVPKGTTHIYWQSVHAGAVKASQELDVRINWIGPVREDARQEQIGIVDNQVINQVDGIVLAPLDAMALRRPVKSAVEEGIPVVIFDSQLADSDEFITSFVATDNHAGGYLAGKELAAMLSEQGKVVVLRYQEGSASTARREQGFLDAMDEYPEIEVVSSEQYGGATKAQAQQAAENLLLRFQNEQGKLTVDGIFTPNESTTYGMLIALQRQRLAGRARFVGFDVEETLVNGIKEGDLDGVVVQDPFKMGYLSVKTLVGHLRGEEVKERINTGVTFVDAENITDPAIQDLINPKIDKWLH